MNTTEQVYFKIDGEWYTDFLRTRFWDEDCGLDYAISMVTECIICDIPKEELETIAVEIIEGRKKFIGINDLELVDDNKNIRPLRLYYKKQEEKIKFYKLKEEIDRYPEMYIDTYLGGWSLLNPKVKDKGLSREELIQYRYTGDVEGYTPTGDSFADSDEFKAGTYLLEDAGYAMKILGDIPRDHEEVMEKCNKYWYEELIAIKGAGKDYKDMTDHEKWIYERVLRSASVEGLAFPYNNPYGDSDINSCGLDFGKINSEERLRKTKFLEWMKEYRIRRKNEPTLEELNDFWKAFLNGDEVVIEKESDFLETQNEAILNAAALKYKAGITDEDLDEAWKYGFMTSRNKGIDEDGNPDKTDDYKSELGWISPTGEFYSCTFAGHHTKANFIVTGSKNLKIRYKEWVDGASKEGKRFDLYEGPEKFLEELGWLKLHNPYGGESYMDTSASTKEPTKRQTDTFYRVKYFFDSKE